MNPRATKDSARHRTQSCTSTSGTEAADGHNWPDRPPTTISRGWPSVALPTLPSTIHASSMHETFIALRSGRASNGLLCRAPRQRPSMPAAPTQLVELCAFVLFAPFLPLATTAMLSGPAKRCLAWSYKVSGLLSKCRVHWQSCRPCPREELDLASSGQGIIRRRVNRPYQHPLCYPQQEGLAAQPKAWARRPCPQRRPPGPAPRAAPPVRARPPLASAWASV